MYLDKRLIPILMYTGDLGLTAPVRRIIDAGPCYKTALVQNKYMDYPRLTDLLREWGLDHSGMLLVSKNMGRLIGYFSKYGVQDRDQNLSNWLVRPDNTAIGIDYENKYTIFIEHVEYDLDFWLYANAGLQLKTQDSKRIREKVRDLGVFSGSAIGHFSWVANYLDGELPPDYQEEKYKESYIEGFVEEFSIPIIVSYEELCRKFEEKCKQDAEEFEKHCL